MPYFSGKGFAKGLLGFVLAMSLATVGCGSSAGTISGKVYYQGVALKGGNVTFLTKDKKVSRLAEIKEDGSYQIEKMPTGEALITVDTSTMKPPQSGNRRANVPPKGAIVPPGYKPLNLEEKAKRYTEIPPQYKDPAQSKLTYTVKGGKQEYDIKLP
ncbi:MAG: hypothetical protein ACRELG_25085 [Gemmataceae bacterium]